MTYELWTPRGIHSWAVVACTCIVLLAQPALFAQFDEEAELPKGLLARYSVGDRFVERLEETISHDWGTSMPDRRLGESDEPFQAKWESQLLIRQVGRHRFPRIRSREGSSRSRRRGRVRRGLRNARVDHKRRVHTGRWLSAADRALRKVRRRSAVPAVSGHPKCSRWSLCPGTCSFARMGERISPCSKRAATSLKPSAVEAVTRPC